MRSVLTTVGSTGGGIMRDLLLGEQPPAALRDWRYAAIAVAAASAIIVAGTLTPPKHTLGVSIKPGQLQSQYALSQAA